MTLIGREGKVPMILSGSSSEEGATILTRASTFFCLSSEMNNCFPTARPRYVTSSDGGSEGSTCLPAVEDHSTAHSGGTLSPEIDTVTLGGLRSSRPGAVSFHHELPIMIAVGGGHRNLQVYPMGEKCGSDVDLTDSVAHGIGAPAFLSIRLLGDLTGHDDNRSLAECDTITCFNIFLQHRPNDAECIGASKRQRQRAERVRESGSVEARGKKTIEISGSRRIGDGSEGLARTSRSWRCQTHCFLPMPVSGKSKGSRAHQG